ncbi:MAG: hypothetical protein NT034_04145 [Candidatus Magasanikbacteria bacterium]|nr:hypothetical protein [Candidatus Magasanikbacteria bacterium]
MNSNFKKILSLTAVAAVFSFIFFLGSEAQVAQAVTDSFTVGIDVTAEISLTCPDTAVSMSSSGQIAGISGGESFGSTVCSVVTNNAAGYSLKVHASTAPALQKGVSVYFDDHIVTPSFNFVSSTASSTFGFSVSSTDAVTAFKNDGSSCGAGSGSSYFRCYRGFNGTSDVEIANGSAVTAGTSSTIAFRAVVGSSKHQETGSYSSTVTVTALTQ